LKTSIIVIIILLLSILLLSVDFYFGRKKHLSEVKKVYFPNRQSDIRLFTKGKLLTEQLFHDIQKAKQYVHVQFFIVKNDPISQQFTNLLKKKAEQGMDVRLLVDWVGSAVLPSNVRDSLKKSGVKFSYSHKPKWPHPFYTLQKRNHRKICVIDGEIGYIGGFNIGKEYVDGDKKLSPWRDYHLHLTGEGVQDLEAVFLSDWLDATGENIKYEDVYIKPGHQGKSPHRFAPSDGAFLENEYIELIRQAEKAITIATPYFVPSTKITQELLACLKRGIALTIIFPYMSDHILVKEASYTYFRQLIPAGADVYQFHKGFFHGKYILIDENLVDIGTANFDKRSLFLNYEINCYIQDPSFIERMKEEIQNDIENSSLLSLNDLAKLGLWNTIKERIAACISLLL